MHNDDGYNGRDDDCDADHDDDDHGDDGHVDDDDVVLDDDVYDYDDEDDGVAASDAGSNGWTHLVVILRILLFTVEVDVAGIRVFIFILPSFAQPLSSLSSLTSSSYSSSSSSLSS